MAKRMLIDALHPEETRVVIADTNQIFDFDFVSAAKKQLKGNIYLAKITRVEPSLQAAFVEYGGGKQGFLPFSEIHSDYYQIPVSDRKRLMEEAKREEARGDTQDDSYPDLSSETSAQGEAQAYGDQPITDESQEAALAADLPLEETSSLPLPPAVEESSEDNSSYMAEQAIDNAVSSDFLPEEQASSLPLAPALEESEIDNLERDEMPQADLSSDLSSEALAKEEALAQGETSAPREGKSEGVETLPNEEEEVQARPKRNVFMRRYKIQEVIRRGQIVLVQVIKEERGNKGCSLTTYLSLAGRYCVLMPNSPKDGGISRKIASAEDRKRLKAISTEMRLADGMSVIIRTAGMDRTRAEIKRDYDYLVKLWNRIREDTLKSNAPALIYEESDIIKRAIRDQYSNDISEIVVEGDEGYAAAKDFMKLLLPSHTPKIKLYTEATPLFYAYNIEEQLLSMHDPVVKLRSGGYIVINPTEALISIDVNSGRATGERNIEETAAKTNLEAAHEVARQLRLRDLAGLIVIDFIDMMESRNRRAVEKALKDSLKADRAKIQLGRISPFGLLEMSRQRLRPSISETNMVQCPHCIGRGFIRSHESMSIQMIRAIEKEASAGVWSGLRLIAPQSVALHLLNHKRDVLKTIEQRYGLSIQVLIGPDLTSSEFNLEKMRRAQGERQRHQDRERERQRQAEPMPELEELVEGEEGNEPAEARESERADNGQGEGDRKRRRRRRGGRNRNRDREDRGPRDDNAGFTPAEGEAAAGEPGNEPFEAAAEEGGEPREPREQREPREPREGRRNRGGRGRRRWRERDGSEAPREGGSEGNREPRQPREGRRDNRGPRRDAPVEGGAPAALPAFALQEPIQPPPPRVPEPVAASAESTPRTAPAKKGWWQKMIELDD